ncbi:hypothetical protein BCR35DRAFT_328956 [Leucosporidium creatinivorum]|uniref:Uncharacterized protein n=1 Tax=Leucosporidium creatinivorum TaxID=106004 RepID=A0A1Y2G1B4_9BASI|nr:hypothetical protein BCR35DRAFT_328956 [Leucosporidium creatinivorum]
MFDPSQSADDPKDRSDKAKRVRRSTQPSKKNPNGKGGKPQGGKPQGGRK